MFIDLLIILWLVKARHLTMYSSQRADKCINALNINRFAAAWSALNFVSFSDQQVEKREQQAN